MSLKSIGFSNMEGIGGQFNVPDIVVRNNNITEIKIGTPLPQYIVEDGLVEEQKKINQNSAQLVRQTDKYDEDENEVNALASPLSQLATLTTDIQTLYNQVVAVTAPSVFQSDTNSNTFVRRGMGIRTTPYQLLSFPIGKTTTYFVSVHLGLSMMTTSGAVVLDQDNMTISHNIQSANLNGTFSQILLKVDGVVAQQMYSVKRTYRGTNIFITGSTYIALTAGSVLSVEIDFTNSSSVGGMDVPNVSAQVYGTNQTDTTNNLLGEIVYNTPHTSQDNPQLPAPSGTLGLNKNKSKAVTIVQF